MFAKLTMRMCYEFVPKGKSSGDQAVGLFWSLHRESSATLNMVTQVELQLKPHLLCVGPCPLALTPVLDLSSGSLGKEGG